MNSAEPCILRVEAAQPIDVDVLRAALAASPISSMAFENVLPHLPEIAAEYARLRASETDHD